MTTATVPGDGDGFGASPYTKARAFWEFYQVRLAKIEYEERIGKLVPKAEVQVAAFNISAVPRPQADHP